MLKELITSNIFFGIALILITFNLALSLKRRFDLIIFNPLLISIILTIGIVLLGEIDYENFNKGSQYISYLLTPTTICLAVPLYENLSILKKDYLAIICGISAGILSSAFTVFPLVALFNLDKVHYITLLPKSITSAFAMPLSEEFGGLVPVTVVVVIISGIIGAIFSDFIFKLFKIKHPVAQGIALGSSAHAMGTSKAFSLGEVQGALASLSLAVSGIMTAISISFFVNLY